MATTVSTTSRWTYAAALLPWHRYRWASAAARLLLLGATVGAGLDGIHTHLGVTAYAEPEWWLMARWVPLLFAGAGLGFGLVPAVVERLSTGSIQKPAWWRVYGALVLFAGAYGASGLLADSWAVCTWLLAVVFVGVWWLMGAVARELPLAVVGAALGVAVEMTLVSRHAFWYVKPHVGGVPVWLPWLYAIGVVTLSGLGRRWLQPQR